MRNASAFEEVECDRLPSSLRPKTSYRLRPQDPDEDYYRDRIDRNFPWISPEEQGLVRRKAIGIAGCGGMGGRLAEAFVRLGVNDVRIADCETFDVSNINRQYAAMRSTVGKSKARETAKLVRRVSDDTWLSVYPEGITEASVDRFLAGCDVVCDEIEALAIPARILLHARARAHGIPVFNCNSVGFSTNLFLYTPESMTMEEALGLSYVESLELRRKADAGDPGAVRILVDAIMRAVVPELPDYSPDDPETNRDAFYRRLYEEQKVGIISTNPGMCSNFLANRILMYLLKDSGIGRIIPETPVMPGYLTIDTAFVTGRIVTEGWMPHAR